MHVLRPEGWERRLEKIRRLTSVRAWWPFLRFAPPGHFYSPIPDLREIDLDASRLFGERNLPLVGINLRPEEQIRTFKTISERVAIAEFSEEKIPQRRYYWHNNQYGLSDAYTLVGMLRTLRPRRVIEVGSGFSTAAMLDALPVDDSPRFTFVEPFPARLRTLLRPEDDVRFELLEMRIQDVPLSTFTTLEANDLLFIDSSHVVKTGSDVVYLMTDVLPRLGSGVVVHIHDIFFPFELPEVWVRNGHGWSENYLLKAFLQFNNAFEIIVFLSWLHNHSPDVLGRVDSRLRNGGGSSIYLRKT